MAFLLQPPQWLMMPTHFLGNGKLGASRESIFTFLLHGFIPGHATRLTRKG